MKPIISTYGIDRLVDGFEHYLLNVKGLASESSSRSASMAKRFLTEQWKQAGGELVLDRLDGPTILRHVLRQRVRCKPEPLRQYASGLRAFLRFLVLSGRISADLVRAVPAIKTGPPAGPSQYLTEIQLQTLVASVDVRTPEGARDQAAILILARMGLRAGEAARLTLDDLNWHQGALRVSRTKGRRERQLPLPASVSKALAHYLADARPAVSHRRLFVTFPHGTPLSSWKISRLVAAALERTQLVFARPGAQLLRRTFATHLAQGGASVKAITDWLGHRRLDTVGLYIRINLPLLQTVALPWPEVKP